MEVRQIALGNLPALRLVIDVSYIVRVRRWEQTCSCPTSRARRKRTWWLAMLVCRCDGRCWRNGAGVASNSRVWRRDTCQGCQGREGERAEGDGESVEPRAQPQCTVEVCRRWGIKGISRESHISRAGAYKRAGPEVASMACQSRAVRLVAPRASGSVMSAYPGGGRCALHPPPRPRPRQRVGLHVRA